MIKICCQRLKFGFCHILLVLLFTSFESTSLFAEDKIRVGESYSNLYSHVWTRVLDEAEINAEFVLPPHTRKRRMFVAGDLILDCCSAPVWRIEPEEVETQLHTIPLLNLQEVYVFRKGGVRPITMKSFELLRIAIVRGFSYEQDEVFTNVIQGGTKRDALELVAAGRADFTIMDEREFKAYMDVSPLPLEIGGVHSSLPLTARVHKSRPDLLPRLNAAIKRLQDRGEIAAIVADIEKKAAAVAAERIDGASP
ncbi:hypothetical protein GCM10017044_13340 [Kordiimonas sediminis]|uniref:Solute-binding protein family 3/N-terminal domain-containing protein n=1 Tax=Kordiimonas sediminis TaxID=1735581 RepID=A0A919AQK6_9PROT|nr:transporter substrate-binding domain-containing protein [Kordiimonas sediminis]GHF19898.1 hypothetical protein GCM10017044_13340 [Kordiimonas sediminis]